MRNRIQIRSVTAASVLALFGAALASTTAGAQDKIDLATWDTEGLYEGFSLDEMLGEDVVGSEGEEIGDIRNILVTPEGQISRVIVEAGGFLDIGDAHLAVPWDQIEIGDDEIVVPVTDDNVDEFDLFGKDYPDIAQNEWKAFDLLSDFVYLEDETPYGIVDDIIANDQGQIKAILVQPSMGFNRPGSYAYPYSGYYGYRYPAGAGGTPNTQDDSQATATDARSPGYHLPYGESEVSELGPFDTSRFEN